MRFERLAEEIRRAREARGWSKAELAFEAGLSQATIWLMDNADRSHLPTAYACEGVEQALGWVPGRVVRILDGRVESADDPVG